MKKIILLLCLSLVLVSCKTTPKQTSTAEPAVVETIEPSERALITIKMDGVEEIVTVGEFEKYYAMQSYDFEKEYGKSVWSIEKDGMTMAEIRQDKTKDYLVRVKIIKKYISQRGHGIDQIIIDEKYTRYMELIEEDEEIKAYYKENGIDETFLRGLLSDQYYLNIFEEVIFEDVSNNEETVNMLFEDRVIRYKARHILLEDEVVLAEVLSLLNNEDEDVDFSDMARLFSTHSTSAVKGGDLGYTLIGNMPEKFEEVALNIEMYTVSEGVQTEYGYHIIFVDDRQMLSDMVELGMPEEEMDIYKTEIIKRYADSETLRVFNELKNNASIVPDEELLKALLIEE